MASLPVAVRTFMLGAIALYTGGNMENRDRFNPRDVPEQDEARAEDEGMVKLEELPVEDDLDNSDEDFEPDH
jgi:hypothetical protein